MSSSFVVWNLMVWNLMIWGFLAVGLVFSSSTTSAFAQQVFVQRVSVQGASAVSAVYGRGVHAYFAGNSSQAEQYFTQAIQSGSSDPRPYYFRAMLRLGLGRQSEAENDMRVGASLEARNPGGQHAIGRALQRVQGSGRRTLEKFRRQARLDRLQRGKQQSQQRYEQLDRRGPTVLRSTKPLPLELPVRAPQGLALPGTAPALVTPGPLAPPPPIQAPAAPNAPQPLQPAAAQPAIGQPLPAAGSGTKAEEDFFGSPAPVTPADGPLGAAPDPEPTPLPAPAPPEANPFGELPSPAPQPETADGGRFGETAEPVPAEEVSEPERVEDDPFGEEAPFSEETEAPVAETEELDPFGDAAGDEEMKSDDSPEEAASEEAANDEAADEEDLGEEEADPFGDSSEPANEDDSFGDSSEPAEENEESPAEEDQPAPESDEDDPFGDFGGVTPQPAGEALAQTNLANAPGPSANAPAGQLFFALGQWLSSRGGQARVAVPKDAESSPADVVVQADFELGPTDEVAKTPANIELPAEDDSYAEPMPSEESPADEDDPFGDF